MTFDGSSWVHDGVPVMRPSGALDLESAPEFEAALLAHLADGPGVVADLGQVPFMDSWGVQVLVRGHLASGQHGSRLVVLPSDQVRHVLETAGLMNVLYITSSTEAGCEEVRRGGMPDR